MYDKFSRAVGFDLEATLKVKTWIRLILALYMYTVAKLQSCFH